MYYAVCHWLSCDVSSLILALGILSPALFLWPLSHSCSHKYSETDSWENYQVFLNFRWKFLFSLLSSLHILPAFSSLNSQQYLIYSRWPPVSVYGLLPRLQPGNSLASSLGQSYNLIYFLSSVITALWYLLPKVWKLDYVSVYRYTCMCVYTCMYVVFFFVKHS